MSGSATVVAVGSPRGKWRDGLRYGALGLPLAFVALPLVVLLPSHYAGAHGVPLATLGALLLAVRLLDAIVDPWIGQAVDRWFVRGPRAVAGICGVAAAVLAAAFHGLLFPPLPRGAPLLAGAALLLLATYIAFSVLSVLHQAWGARLGGDAAARARTVGWREGLALAGVLLASVLPSAAGLLATSVVFACALALATAALLHSDWPRGHAATAATDARTWRAPLADRRFLGLLGVYLVNGVAAAVPATLLLFFVRDRLQAQALEPLFLATYFATGALSMPLWVGAVRRIGLVRSWLAGMLLAVGTFAGTAWLGAGDAAAFVLVCAASGLALGADLVVPPALLAGVIQRAGHGGRHEGAYFGWWNGATKLNLALAAGLALPALQALGYTPGTNDPQALAALAAAYAVLPCVLKLAAAALLWRGWLARNGGRFAGPTEE